MTAIISKIRKNNVLLVVLLSIPLMLILFFLQVDSVEAAGLGSRIANSIKDALMGALKTIVGLAFQIVGWLLGLVSGLLLILAGQFLDIAINFGLNSQNIRGVSGILLGWGIFRDLVNMLFIFILLYVGIATIIQAGSFGIKKVLANLVIVALLVNFSFFLTGFVIDVGNVMAGAIYEAITPLNNGVTAGIGGQFIENMSVTQFKNQTGDLPNSIIGDDAFKNGLMSIMNAIFYFFATFALFMGGFLFIVRHVMLVFIIILAPVAFAAFILDSTRKHWKKWFGELMGATFVAPIYLLMISVVLAISEADVFTTAPEAIATGDQVASPLLDSTGLILNYLIITGLLFASYTVSKNVSGSITSISGKWAGKVVGGASGAAYRHTAGRAMGRFADSKLLADMESKGGWRGYGARAAMRASEKGAGASGDLRSTLKNVGINAGTAQGRGGYTQYAKDEKKRVKARDKRMGEGEVTNKDYRDINRTLDGGGGVVAAEKQLEEARKTGDKAQIEKAKDKLETAKIDFGRTRIDKYFKKKQERGRHAVGQLKRIKSLDTEGYLKARRARKEGKRVVKREKQTERQQLTKQAQETAKDKALGTKKTRARSKEIYVDNGGNEVPKEQAKTSEAVYEKRGAEFVGNDGRIVADKKDARIIKPAGYRTETVQEKQYKLKKKAKDGSDQWTTDERHGDLDRNKDGRQEQYRRTLAEGTIAGKFTGDNAIHRDAIGEARAEKPELDKIKEIIKDAEEPSDAPGGGGSTGSAPGGGSSEASGSGEGTTT